MNFYLDERNFNKATVILNSDLSFGTLDNKKWDFQISIECYPVLLLNFNYDLKLCTGIEGCLFLDKCLRKELHLNITKKGFLKVDKFLVEKDAYGMTYNLSDKRCYYDDISKIFGIGNIDDSDEVFEIGIGQYVKIKDGQILALFINFSNLHS